MLTEPFPTTEISSTNTSMPASGTVCRSYIEATMIRPSCGRLPVKDIIGLHGQRGTRYP